MFVVSLLVALASLVSADKILNDIEGRGHSCHRHHHRHPHHPQCIYEYWPDAKSKLNTLENKAICSNSPSVQVQPLVDQGIYPFTFTKNSTWAFQTFLINPVTPVFVNVWDCFCGGDSFEVYDNGNPLFTAIGNDDTECETYGEYPLQCLVQQGVWASNWELLFPGPHNITIKVLNSPYNSGTGFISFNSWCGFIDKKKNLPFNKSATQSKLEKIFKGDKATEDYEAPCCFITASCRFGNILPYCPKEEVCCRED